jgi:hypothetical protein
VTAYSVVRLWCDYRDEVTGYHCTESFETQTPGFERAREVAALKGWTRTAASGADEGDRCPKHSASAPAPSPDREDSR